MRVKGSKDVVEIAAETSAHLGKGRRDEKDVKIQLKTGAKVTTDGAGNSNDIESRKSLPGNLIENQAKRESSGEREKGRSSFNEDGKT